MAKSKPAKRKPAKNKASGAKSVKAETPAEPSHSDSQRQGDHDSFPVVGIGASAGGLKALQTLLENMPDEPGLAIVIVQHLDPTRKSLTPELLNKATAMQVGEVEDEPVVRPNRVYVIPPGKYLSMSGGELHLSEPDRPRGTRMAIDFFLRSLAADRQQCAMGIILSGTGTDGTLGIKAIKAAGGLVIAQKPDTAEFDGMPRSAINSGVVDHTLTPEDIPDVLIRYAQHPYVREGRADSLSEHETTFDPDRNRHDFHAIMALLRTHTQHDFRSYKDKTLIRRTRRRMCLHHLDNYGEYAEFLRGHEVELDALAKDLLISVTEFFRDADAWESLRRLVIRPMLEKRDHDEPIRVWTPGCATGEEPYSVAMLILEELKRAEKLCLLNVFASDIDRDAIAFAREGRYPKSVQADLPPERLNCFFEAGDEEGCVNVKKSLREVVVFAEQNLLSDPPFSRLDLICCRNLLIYLKPEMQEKVIALFHFALRDDGVLLLGSAETVGRQTDLFEPLDKGWRIFRRSGPTRPSRVDIPIFDTGRRREFDVQTAVPQRREVRVTALAQRRLLELLAPAAVLVDGNWHILYISGNVDPYLTHNTGTPTDDVLDKCRQGMRSRLRVAVQTALSEARVIHVAAQVRRGGRFHPVDITVRLIHDREQNEQLALVVFDEHRRRKREIDNDDSDEADGNGAFAAEQGLESLPDDTDSNPNERGPADAAEHFPPPQGLDDHTIIRRLEEELTHVRDELQTSIEQYETSNEEYQASHEEVMSTNEELQSTNEELQSLNEELSTVNFQLASKLAELETKHADLENLLAVTSVGTICVDTDLCVRWFTPAAQEVVRLRETDKGRPLADLVHDFTDCSLIESAAKVLAELAPLEDEVSCEDDRTFMRRVTPYRAEDHRVGGVVITFIEITERKGLEKAIADASETEKRRIGRDIHDGVGQELTGLRYLALTHAEALAAAASPEAEVAGRIAQGLTTVQEGLRAAVRDLVPVEVDEKGLMAALSSLTERVTQNHHVSCTFVSEPPVAIENHLLATQLYCVAQEAVSNALRHARPNTIMIQLMEDETQLVLKIIDDGSGITLRPRHRGLGLSSMFSRASIIGGRLDIAAPSSGGTVVACTVRKRNL